MPTVEKELVVMAPADTVYQVWRNFEHFPDFMQNVEEVRDLGGGRSHWRAKGPLGQAAEWDAEIVVDDAGHAIGWRSVESPDASVRTEGLVMFQPEGEATRLRVRLGYEPAAGGVANVVAAIFANPDKQVEEDLQRFKEGMERGAQYAQSSRIVREGDSLEDAPPQSQEAAMAHGDAEERDESQVVGRRPRMSANDAETPLGPGMPDDPQHGPTTTSTPGGTLGAPTEADLKRNQQSISERTDTRGT